MIKTFLLIIFIYVIIDFIKAYLDHDKIMKRLDELTAELKDKLDL